MTSKENNIKGVKILKDDLSDYQLSKAIRSAGDIARESRKRFDHKILIRVSESAQTVDERLKTYRESCKSK